MSLIFKAGDKIRVKENGLTGEILGATILGGEECYVMFWQHYSQPVPYVATQVNELWEKLADANESPNFQLPQGSNWVPSGIEFYGLDETKPSCDHKWVDAGFMFTKMVCYHCGVDKA